VQKISLLLLAFLLAFGQTFAKGTLQNDRGSEKKTAKRQSLIFLPVVFYTPETRWAGGGLLNYFFTLSDDAQKNKPSTLMPSVIYTQNHQVTAELILNLFFPKDAYRLNGYLSFNRFPDKFYGIGNNTSAKNEENYLPQFFRVRVKIQKKVADGLYAGLSYEYENSRLTDFTGDGLLAKDDIPGSRGGTVSGIGAVITSDSRDRIFAPATGRYYRFSVQMFRSAWASDYRFTRYAFDLRNYFSPFSSHVLALRVQAVTNKGQTPFRQMPLLGGQFLMRGIYQGRFRDKNMITVQSEYRLPLRKRFGLTGFLSAGEVAPQIDRFALKEFKYSYGMGLRFMLNPKEGVNLRMDFGFSKDDSGIYLSIGEAF